MSIFDIRQVFTASIASSSINYVRNYNFNQATITDIPIILTNGGPDIPITVNITTTEPWMQIVEPNTGLDLKYPNGNVVLGPTSSKEVLLKIDLPPSIEEIPETTIRPNIIFELKSGSFGIVPTTTGTQGTSPKSNKRLVISTDNITLAVGQTVTINYTIYEGTQQLYVTPNLNIVSDDPSVARISKPSILGISYSLIRVTGVTEGNTRITFALDDVKLATTVTVLQNTSDQGQT
jgi:hypothetical protein